MIERIQRRLAERTSRRGALKFVGKGLAAAGTAAAGTTLLHEETKAYDYPCS